MDIEGAQPNWRMQSRTRPPAGSEGFKNNIEIDFSGVKQSAASSVGDNRGCRHFPAKLSDSWMPRRMLKECIQNLDSSFRPEGTRKVPQPDRSAEMTRFSRRRYDGDTGNVDNCGRLTSGAEPHFDNQTAATWDSKYVQSRRRVFDEYGDRMAERPADELSMERTMCRKKRVDLGTGKDIQGNKCYNNPEYSHKYWSQEGLNPSGTMRKRVTPIHSTHTLDMDEDTLNWKPPRRATFAEKQQHNAKRDEMNEVSLLPKTRKQNAAAKYSSLLKTAQQAAEAQ